MLMPCLSLGQPCDPIEVIEAVRTDRPGSVSHIAQYVFLYKVRYIVALACPLLTPHLPGMRAALHSSQHTFPDCRHSHQALDNRVVSQ